MNELQKLHPIDRARLDEEFYLQSLLQEGLRSGLLEQTELESLRLQMPGLLAHETGRFTHGESSSVRVETAESIFNSIAYTVGLFLKTMAPGDGILLFQQKPLKEVLRMGRELIRRKFRVAKLMYLECMASRIQTPNLAYDETLEGLSMFFQAYDMEFGAHETPAMIDYPVSGPPIRTVGIEYMLEYTKRLLDENRELSLFTPGQIHTAMLDYDPGYADLLVNIYEQVIKYASGRSVLPDAPMETYTDAVHIADGMKMTDEELRAFAEELGNCRFASDKACMIRRKVSSFEDLADILAAGCLAGAEFDVFAVLDEPYLALLLRESADREDLHITEYEKEWQDHFIRYFQTLDCERRNRIAQLSGKITLQENF